MLRARLAGRLDERIEVRAGLVLQYASCTRKPTLVPSGRFVVPSEILILTRLPHAPGPTARTIKGAHSATAVTAPLPARRQTNARVPPFSKNPFMAYGRNLFGSNTSPNQRW
jgi:hypothetical protein